MAYGTIVEVANSSSLQYRIAACAADEGLASDPVTWAYENRWKFASQPEWADAWQFAVDTGNVNVNPDTGARVDVINDQMILAAVQSMLPGT